MSSRRAITGGGRSPEWFPSATDNTTTKILSSAQNLPEGWSRTAGAGSESNAILHLDVLCIGTDHSGHDVAFGTFGMVILVFRHGISCLAHAGGYSRRSDDALLSGAIRCNVFFSSVR